jgi:ribosomal protein L37AE/L43A
VDGWPGDLVARCINVHYLQRTIKSQWQCNMCGKKAKGASFFHFPSAEISQHSYH